jgi:hypothetical protein
MRLHLDWRHTALRAGDEEPSRRTWPQLESMNGSSSPSFALSDSATAMATAALALQMATYSTVSMMNN